MKAWKFCFVLFLASRLTAGAQITNNVYPIDLPTALRLVNAQSIDIQIARRQLDEAEANHDSAVEKFYPWASPSATYYRHDNEIQNVDGSILDVHKQSYSVGGALSAQMTLGDAIYDSLASKQLATASSQALATQRDEAIFEAALGYFELAKDRALVEVTKEAQAVSEGYQKQVHEAVGTGVAFRGDEMRVQTQTEHYQVLLRQALEQQRMAAADLAQVLHLSAAVELTPPDAELTPLNLIETNRPLDSLVKQALQYRPELRESDALWAAAKNEQTGATYGPLIPTLGAQFFAGGLGGGADGRTPHFGQTEELLVGLSWKVGPGGLFDAGRVKATKSRAEIARLRGAKLQDEIIRQVVASHTHMLSLLDQIATTKQSLSTAAETLQLTRDRKQFGVGLVLEDIQAQQELVRAKTEYVSAVAEFNKAQYGLSKAVGHAP